MAFATVPANQSRIALYWLREGVDEPEKYGIVPSAGTPDTLNILNEDLTGDRATLRAELANVNRLPGPLMHVGTQGQNKNLNVHLAPSVLLEDLWEMLLCNEWATATITATTLSAAASDNSYNDSGSGLVAAGFVAGQTLKVSGFATGADNGVARITSVTAGKMIVSGLTLEDEIAGQSVTIAGDYLTNGTKTISATAERHYTDLSSSNEFQAIPGIVINQGTVSFEPQQLFTCGFQCNHAGPLTKTAATAMPNAANAAADISLLIADASNNMSSFRIDGTLLAEIQMFNFALNNNFSPIPVAGNLRPQWQNGGTAALTGGMRALWLDGSTIVTALDAFTAMRASYVVSVPAYTHDYIFEIHRLKSTRFGDFPRSGGTDPVMLDFSWEAEEATDAGLADRWITISKVLQ